LLCWIEWTGWEQRVSLESHQIRTILPTLTSLFHRNIIK
jgi:hypothetical protein